MKPVKILTIDIETTPLKSVHWGLFDQNISVDQIDTEWTVMSFAAKWLDKKEVIYMDTGGRGAKKVRDDKAILIYLWKLLNEADLIVAQNGVSFDVKKINARMVMNGMKPYAPVRVIDTMLAAKKYFKFTSNKLAWMSKYLSDQPKYTHKKFPGIELWLECLKDNPVAWAELKKYNIRDTVGTEKVYLTIRPWIEQHPNIGTFNLRGDVQCPKCGGSNVTQQGTRVLQLGVYQRYQCQDCGGWSRGKNLMNDKETRKVKLVA